MLNRIVKCVKDQLPKFNDDLIINLRKKEVEGLADFIAERYRECATIADPNLRLTGYEIVPPMARISYELKQGIKKNAVNINQEEAILVDYKFEHYDQQFSIPMYVPYLYENSTIMINGTKYECLLSVTEKLFSTRVISNGVTVKVVRSPISCYKNTLYPFSDVFTNTTFMGNIVSCKLYLSAKTKKKKLNPTIIHYLLCKFSLPEVLARFDIPVDAASFIQHENQDDKFWYFKTKNTSVVGEQIFLKVNREYMKDDRMLYEIAAAIVYVMSNYRFVTYEALVSDSKQVFEILLGKIIYDNNITRLQALNYMDKHIESVDHYLDNYTREIFAANKIIVNDIYDVLAFIVKNISQIITNFPNNNMYNKRVEAINNVIIDNLVRTLNSRIYRHERRSNSKNKADGVKTALNVQPRFILKTLSGSDNIRFNPQVYSDNWLLSIGGKMVKRLSASEKAPLRNGKRQRSKVRGSGINSQVNKFHPSMCVVESLIGFSSKPGTNCLVNPYAEIDQNNGYVENQFAKETAHLLKYLLTNAITR